MRLKTLFAMLVIGTAAFAQNDPVIMTVNGTPVTRSEFEYSYNKNNSDGVIDKKTVDEYVDLFINYKLKVAAALDAHLDTLVSFQNEFAQYRDQQIRPTFITDQDVEREAREIYTRTQHFVDSLGGLIKPAHILIMVGQKATEAERRKAEQRADSVYNAIKQGAKFEDLAKKVSDDKGSAQNGGVLGWIQPQQTVKEFESVAYSLNKGEISKPVLSPYGYHIIRLDDKSMFFPFDSLKADIFTFIDRRGIREKIIDDKIDEIVKADGNTTKEKLMEQRAMELSAKDSDMANLIREYHDGLLLYEISNSEVWDKAAKDEAGLANFFKKNKKKYTWDSPRFKGMAYHVKEQADVKAVKNCVKGLAFDKWAEKLRTTFNADSVKRIRVEKGIFKVGDNPLVDREVFKKKDAKVVTNKDYPIDATYGKVIKAPKEYSDVRGQVVADYQDQLEKEWVARLRERYPVVVNKDVLATVNKH